jgi:hypothetical protein
MAAITREDFEQLLERLGEQGQEDLRWSERLESPEDNFASETIYVICNSGMKHTVAVGIFRRVMRALRRGDSASAEFGHKGKAAAIDWIWANRLAVLIDFLQAPDRLAYCGSLPWVGGITKYHVAKNFGVDVAKPDVHLKRLADREGVTAQALCERLAAETGYRVATIDTLLWRACATGLLDSRTGALRVTA